MCRAQHELTIATRRKREPIRKSSDISEHSSLISVSIISGPLNTVGKTATGVTPAEVILNNSLKSMSGQLDSWMSTCEYIGCDR
jgi:hypothetical protein